MIVIRSAAPENLKLLNLGVNIVLIGSLDGMEMVSHLSLVLIAEWYLVANDRRR